MPGITLGRETLLDATLILIAGATNTWRLRWLRRMTDEHGAVIARPMDLTGHTARLHIRRDDRLILDLSDHIALADDGLITISAPSGLTAGMPATIGRWDLLIIRDDDVTRLAAGTARIIPITSIAQEAAPWA